MEEALLKADLTMVDISMKIMDLNFETSTDVINNESANEGDNKCESFKLCTDEMSSHVYEDMVSTSSNKPKKKLKLSPLEFRKFSAHVGILKDGANFAEYMKFL